MRELSFAVSVLLGLTSAVKLRRIYDSFDFVQSDLQDINYNDVWSYSGDSDVAAGFLQINSCVNAGVEGVNCLPETELFATGMNGDEDLGEDITMKGEPYHYNQKMMREDPPKKPAGYESVDDGPEKVHVLQTPIDKTRTTFYGQKKDEPATATTDQTTSVAPGTETVSILDTPHCETHTTYYPKKQNTKP